MDVLRMAVEERRELLALCEGLTPAQWEVPSLCPGWRVRDVVAHVVSYEGLGVRQLAGRMAAARGSLDRSNAAGVARLRGASTDELVAQLAAHLEPRGLTAAFGGRIALTDGLVHQQDVRRPLGLPRPIDPERLRTALSFALVAPPIRGAWTVRGVRVVAVDCDWSHGAGPEARGPGEAVLMAVAGRAGVAHELSGPGAARLQQRLG